MPNADPQTALVPRLDRAKGKIWSHIRQAWFLEFPEELVRQQFVCTSANEYGFALEQMGEELETQHGRDAVEADIVIWRTVQDKADQKPPLIVVECMSDNVTINARAETEAKYADTIARETKRLQEALAAHDAARRKGGKGNLPVRVGDSPTGRSGATPGRNHARSSTIATFVPSGGSPDGTGQWPVLPKEIAAREEVAGGRVALPSPDFEPLFLPPLPRIAHHPL